MLLLFFITDGGWVSDARDSRNAGHVGSSQQPPDRLGDIQRARQTQGPGKGAFLKFMFIFKDLCLKLILFSIVFFKFKSCLIQLGGCYHVFWKHLQNIFLNFQISLIFLTIHANILTCLMTQCDMKFGISWWL